MPFQCVSFLKGDDHLFLFPPPKRRVLLIVSYEKGKNREGGGEPFSSTSVLWIWLILHFTYKCEQHSDGSLVHDLATTSSPCFCRISLYNAVAVWKFRSLKTWTSMTREMPISTSGKLNATGYHSVNGLIQLLLTQVHLKWLSSPKIYLSLDSWYIKLKNTFYSNTSLSGHTF